MPRPGFPVAGPDRAAASAHFASMTDSMTAHVRHVYQAGLTTRSGHPPAGDHAKFGVFTVRQVLM